MSHFYWYCVVYFVMSTFTLILIIKEWDLHLLLRINIAFALGSEIASLCRSKLYQYMCEPCILAQCVPTWWQNSFLFEKWFYLLENDLKSPLIFVLFLKRVNKIRKKTLSVTPYFGKGGPWETGLGSGVRLLIEKVR